MFDKYIAMGKRRMLIKKLIWAQMLGLTGGSNLPWQTFTGNPLQFNAPKAHTLKSATVEFAPKQDLHGYANPWPPGGGANIYDGEYEEGYYDISDGSKGSSTTWSRSKNPIPCQESTSYRFIFNKQASAGSLGYVLFYDSTDNYLSSVQMNSTTYGDGQVFTTPQNCAYMKWYANYRFLVECEACIELSSITGFHPYSNICPISGWDGVSVWGAGENLVDASWIHQGGYIRAAQASESTPLGSVVSSSGWSYTDFIAVAPSSQYSTTIPKYTSASAAGIAFYDANKTAIRGVNLANQGGTQYTFTTDATCHYIRFCWQNADGDEAGLFLGGKQDYVQPTVSTTSLTFPTTVYGGTASVANGVLEETGGLFDQWTLINSRGNVNNDGTGRIFSKAVSALNFSPIDADGNNVAISNYLTKKSNMTWEQLPAGSYIAGANSIIICTENPNDTNADLVQWVQDKGIQLFLAKKTHTTIQLTPQQVEALKGINTMWTDGDNLTVEARGEAVNLNALQSLNMLLGGRYYNNGTADEPTDEEALDILLGGKR